MNNDPTSLSRRMLLAGLGGATLAGLSLRNPVHAAAPRKALTLRATIGQSIVKAGGEPVARPVLALAEAVTLQRGDQLSVRFENRLPRPALLSWRGLDGAAAAEPLIGRQPVPPGGDDSFILPLATAGTLLVDARLVGDGSGAPLPALPLLVQEAAPPAVDADQLFLIEDFRLGLDGQPLTAGTEPGDAPPLYTVNGQPSVEITLRPNSRLRFRFINACQRNVIAIRIDDHDLRVMALDSQPAEPFLAHSGTLVLAPGSRVDALLDATRPAGSSAAITLHDGGKPATIARLVYADQPPLRPAPLPLAAPLADNGLPARLALGAALRVDLALGAPGAPQPDWLAPDALVPAARPAFQVKRGRTVVLALSNRAALPMVFHLHGHHFRLLDRLDDGWKPFWLDTLAIDAGQTQRIAFAAEHPGRWLIEAMAATWSAPRQLRSYLVS